MEIALYRPEIPPNTGNISRLSVCTGTRLHIIGEPSFSLDEKRVKRAGLDYWDQLDLHLHDDWLSFRKKAEEHPRGKSRIFLFSKFATQSYASQTYQKDDIIVFGRETSGFPDEVTDDIRLDYPQNLLRIPVAAGCRSLNLGNAVAIVLYEGLRQTGFEGLESSYGEHT